MSGMSLESDQAQHARLWHAGHVEAESLTFDLSNLSFSIVQSHPWYSLPPHTGYGGYSPAGAWKRQIIKGLPYSYLKGLLSTLSCRHDTQ